MTSRVPKKRTSRARKSQSPPQPAPQEMNIILQEQLAQATAALKDAREELDAFVHSVSHDLRAPLRHIAGFTDLLRTHLANSDEPVAQRYIATITSATVRMEEMIDKLLMLSRIGREPLRMAPLNLRQLVDETIGGLHTQNAERKIHWRVAKLPAVAADRALLSIALNNLLSNAVKFTAERAPAVIEIDSHSENGTHRIAITDNGVGFDMRYADNLFKVFQRLHPPGDFAGTGMGLASVKRIIERHGGRVWAQGEPGKGATFYFTLPATTT